MIDHIELQDWNEREISSRDAMGVHVESQLRGGTARVRGSGTVVLPVEPTDGVRASAAADCREAYGAGNPQRLYDCIPYSSVCGDRIYHELHRPADAVQAV